MGKDLRDHFLFSGRKIYKKACVRSSPPYFDKINQFLNFSFHQNVVEKDLGHVFLCVSVPNT